MDDTVMKVESEMVVEEEVKVDEEAKKVIVSVTSNSVKTGIAPRRNSTGKVNTTPSVLSSEEKLHPDNVRSSTSSCHDFCKYGRKHVFQPKKRLPRRFSSDSMKPDKVKQADVPAPKVRRKKPELTVKTEENIHNALEEIQLVDDLAAVNKEPLEASPSRKLSEERTAFLEMSPYGEVDESFVSMSIETANQSPPDQIYPDASESGNLESSSPTEKRVISEEPAMPLPWSENSSTRSQSMELELPSPAYTPMNQVEKSCEEFAGEETMTASPGTESMPRVDEPKRSKATTQNRIKAKSTITSKRSIAPAKAPSSQGAMKLKTPIPKSAAGTVEKSIMKLKSAKEQKTIETKVSPRLRSIPDSAKSVREKKTEFAQRPALRKMRSPSRVDEARISLSVRKESISELPRVTKQASSSIKRIDTLRQPLVSSKPRTPVSKSTPKLVSSRRLSLSRIAGSKLTRSFSLSKSIELLPKSSRLSLSTKTPLGRESSSLKAAKHGKLMSSSPAKVETNAGKLENTNEEVEEKTIYAIEPKASKTQPKPIRKEQKKNQGCSTSLSSDGKAENESVIGEARKLLVGKEKTNRTKPVHRSLKREEMKKSSKPTTAHSEPKVPSPHKLKFRSGNVVSPSPENTTPRRLKFRPGKGSTANQSSKEIVRRIFRRRRSSCGSASELAAPSRVVLRHQEMEKKEVQGLFNHVIEETASKLVQTRKSKVKALVGAFETIISLQEGRVAPIV